MTTFKNTKFTSRNYECTNLVVCEAEAAPGENWTECDSAEKDGLTQLYIERANRTSVTYYGYL
jgi:hypothetical protein